MTFATMPIAITMGAKNVDGSRSRVDCVAWRWSFSLIAVAMIVGLIAFASRVAALELCLRDGRDFLRLYKFAETALGVGQRLCFAA